MADNATTVFRFLRGKGLSPAQAAGVVGSLQQESGKGLSPTAQNPSSGAYGIGQWLGGRKSALMSQPNPASLRTQLNHLWSELQGPERGALAKIKQAHTLADAASAWTWGFERPGRAEANVPARVSNAQAVFKRLHGAGGDTSVPTTSGGMRASAASAPSTRTTVTKTPGVDNRVARAALIQSFLDDNSSVDPLEFATQAKALEDVAPTETTKTIRVAGAPGVTGATPEIRGAKAGSGAASALTWAESKLGDPAARETGGANRGRLPDYLNQRFGFGASGGQPWCAMFTSAAVTKGGAPPSARTASVAAVRQKAQQGQGYVRGILSGHQARPGDLILFGNSHIGMVKGVSGGKIRYVGGNQSNAVTEGTASAAGANIVRPKYGANH